MDNSAVSAPPVTPQASTLAAQPTPLQRWWVRQQVRWWNLLGQPEKTSAVYESAVTQWPLWGDGVEGLAFCMAGDGRTAQAIALLQVLVAREGTRANAWFNLGFLLQHIGPEAANTTQHTAEFALRRATEIDPRHDRAWYGLALELIAKGHYADAVPCLKACTQIQPMSPYAWYQLGRTYHDLGDEVKTREVLLHLKTFDPKISGQLQRELQLPTTATKK